eukprot:15206548-Heterocapsa_arctica.AAC.1
MRLRRAQLLAQGLLPQVRHGQAAQLQLAQAGVGLRLRQEELLRSARLPRMRTSSTRPRRARRPDGQGSARSRSEGRCDACPGPGHEQGQEARDA